MAVMNPYNYVRPDYQEAQSCSITKKTKLNKTKTSYAKQDAYLAQKVMNAKPQELTMMLYEGMVRFIKLAKYYLSKNDMEKTNENSIKAQNIVRELRATLNMDYDISHDLDRLYDFLYNELVSGNMNKNEANFNNALEISEDLAGTWREAMKNM